MNLLPDPRWRQKEGIVLCRGRGLGPRNVLVRTAGGEMVVVPRGNVRLLGGRHRLAGWSSRCSTLLEEPSS